MKYSKPPLRRHIPCVDLGAAIFLLAAAIFVTWPVWQEIGSLAWNDEESSYVLLAPFAIGWIAFVRRDRLRVYRLQGRWFGAVLVAGGYLSWCLGDHFDRISLWYFGAVLTLFGAIIAGVGTDVVKQFAPAVVAILFLVPTPAMIRQNISLPLQTIAVHATQSICQVFGMDVQLQGSTLEFHDVQVGVVEACNGLRMIFTLAVVCYTFAFISPIRNGARMLVLCAIPLVALAFNVVRLVLTVAVFGNTSLATAESFHNIAGWLMLVAAFGFLVALLRVLRWAGVPIQADQADPVDRSKANTLKGPEIASHGTYCIGVAQ